MPEDKPVQPINPEPVPAQPTTPVASPNPTATVTAPLAGERPPLVAPTALPEAVQAIKRIEQKNNLPPIPAPTNPPPPKSGKRTHLFNFIPITGRIGMVFKVLLAGIAAIVALFLVMIILTLTSLDTSIIKLSLSGAVVDTTGKPVQGAVLVIDGKQGTSDALGTFSIGGLSVGQYKVHITANGFETVDQDVALSRSFLNYNNVRQFILHPAGIATLTGKVISPTTGYKFTNDAIFINDKSYRLNDDGTFKIDGIVTGQTTFIFKSVNFKDETRVFQLAAGEMSLPDINLVAAGDIVASAKSWIREDIVTNLKITVEGVDDQYVTVADDGSLRVRDLEVGKEYKMRTEYPGYETRDYTITIAQGENQLFNFKVVEKGFVPFQRSVDGNLELFVANFDGLNEKQLTSGTTNPFGEYLEGSNVYFMSNRDNLFGDNNNVVNMLAYVVPVAGGNMQRLTTTVNNLGRVIPNLKAGKLANVRQGDTDKSRVLEMLNLQGNNANIIESIPEGQFDTINISDDGTTLWYVMQNNAHSIDGLYHAATDSIKGKGDFVLNKGALQIFTVSNSGDRVIYSATNPDTGLQDLYMYTYSTKQDILVKAAYTGSQYQFVRGSETQVAFIDKRDGATNLFLLDLSNNTDKALSTFSDSVEGVEAIFQQSGYVLYRTNKGLYVIDVNQPHSGKLVTNNLARYTGHDF